MTDNEKLARWQGWKNDTTLGWCRPICGDSWFTEVETPDCLNNDAAAMSLLDTLVEKGYTYYLSGDAREVDLRIFKGGDGICLRIKPTRREAVVSALLRLIEKEN